MRNRSANSGFTIVELMIVIAIVGILAALATAAYQTYTVRKQVSEGLNMAGSAKVPITDAYTRDGVAPIDRAAAGMPPDPAGTPGGYVRNVSISNGRIDVTFGGALAHTEIVDETVSITPYETGGNTVVWRCGNAVVPADGVPLANGDAHLPPTVEIRYLPSSCR